MIEEDEREVDNFEIPKFKMIDPDIEIIKERPEETMLESFVSPGSEGFSLDFI